MKPGSRTFVPAEGYFERNCCTTFSFWVTVKLFKDKLLVIRQYEP